MATSQPKPLAAALLDDPRFQQTFEVPPDATHPSPFTVTYCDFGFHHPDGPDRDNVVLFCGPLFASRYLHITKDKLAKKHRIRFITLDRPGFGGTTPVNNAEDRVKAWLRLVPALLKHLGIRHVAILSQSAGTIYALNTLLYLPHLLHPTRPYAALCVPWVHPLHSRASLMSTVHKLPASAIGTVDVLATFFNSTMRPLTGFSGGILSALTGSLGLSKSPPVVGSADVDDVAFEDAVMPDVAAHAFRQGCKGMGQEAIMLLKRAGPKDVWGPWTDVDTYVPLLASQLSSSTPGEGADGQLDHGVDRQLKIEVFFSEQDNMIGNTAGPKWFDECWREAQPGKVVEYTSAVVPGTDHDTILDLRFGIVEKIFEAVEQRKAGSID